MGYLETENCLYTKDGSCARDKAFKDFVENVHESLQIKVSFNGVGKRSDTREVISKLPLELRQEFESIWGSSCANCPIKKK